MKYKLVKNKLGFFEVAEKPSEIDLKKYYAEKYYQEPTGQYQNSYTLDETIYFKNKAIMSMETLHMLGRQPETMLELGCGEGFFANYFNQKGVNITLNDLSNAGLQKFNSHLIEFLTVEDALVYVEDLVKHEKTFDFIAVDNVLEHVIDPFKFAKDLQKVMHSESIAKITIPNDFSAFQDLLLNKKVTKETWVSPPDHITYFNTENCEKFLKFLGFEILSIQVDFPVEVFLLNPHSNYWKDRALGKGAHNSRVQCTNYLIEKDVKTYIKYCELGAKLDFGRDIIVYVGLIN